MSEQSLAAFDLEFLKRPTDRIETHNILEEARPGDRLICRFDIFLFAQIVLKVYWIAAQRTPSSCFVSACRRQDHAIGNCERERPDERGKPELNDQPQSIAEGDLDLDDPDCR